MERVSAVCLLALVATAGLASASRSLQDGSYSTPTSYSAPAPAYTAPPSIPECTGVIEKVCCEQAYASSDSSAYADSSGSSTDSYGGVSGDSYGGPGGSYGSGASGTATYDTTACGGTASSAYSAPDAGATSSADSSTYGSQMTTPARICKVIVLVKVKVLKHPFWKMVPQENQYCMESPGVYIDGKGFKCICPKPEVKFVPVVKKVVVPIVKPVVKPIPVKVVHVVPAKAFAAASAKASAQASGGMAAASAKAAAQASGGMAAASAKAAAMAKTGGK